MDYLFSLLSIITVNLVLSGDNALVIALACRRLPDKQRKVATIIGGAGAIILRIVLTFLTIYLLQIPYLQLMGGLLLFWIALKLAKNEHHDNENVSNACSLGEAVKTIIVADVVMSLDNVIAIAGVAKGDVSLLIVGLAISIPLIIWGSKLINMLMERWPIIIVIGAAFLGWTAGEMITSDTKTIELLTKYPWLNIAFPEVFAGLIVIVSMISSKKRIRKR
ncbi:TerC family protein [Dendrosporobacter sp. 1207_IL3150]|uniref:TerC family protein n=1 Tax=Dendrosporobacter sp. 1207_IL3150 TaxID=3084054 RepID=UPI002FDAEF23